MSQPIVCAVMLTRDRPEMARRAVECFRAQTYPAKRLYVFDSGETPDIDCLPQNFTDYSIAYHRSASGGRRAAATRISTIGELRNLANGWCAADGNSDILVHWDDDDWSHPTRIAEQVALLQASGADCVGYREMLFWRDVQRPSRLAPPANIRQAWLYYNPLPSYALGTSLCYWRKAWEQRPFEATSLGEDARFVAGLKCVGVSSVSAWEYHAAQPTSMPLVTQANSFGPRMIARIHGGNTATGYTEQNFRMQEWKRVLEWDAHCRSVFA